MSDDSLPLFRYGKCPECPLLQAKIADLEATLESTRTELEAARSRIIGLSMTSFRMTRSTDPETSAAAAEEAAKAARKVAAAVRVAMADGVDRNDEEILLACATQGYTTSLDRIRHGRLALEKSGELVSTGHTRLTVRGKPSKTWIAVNVQPPTEQIL